MDFFNSTYLILGMLIVPVALAIDWAVRNGNWDAVTHSTEQDIFDEDDGWNIGPQGYGFYSGGIKMSDDD